MKIKYLLIFVLAGGLLLSLVSCGLAPDVATVGKPAPDFVLVDLDGKTWTLSDLRGQVVFVNFWATWCPPCREEMPSMQRLYDQLPRDSFKMLAILNRDEAATARSFLSKFAINIPVPTDPENRVGKIYGLTGLPETFIVDKKGILREKFIGPAKWDSPEIVGMLNGYINQ